MTSPKSNLSSLSRRPESTGAWASYSETYKERYKNDPAIKRKKQEWRKRNREYAVWRSMINRCMNPDSVYYQNYGGRGITVCDRWMGKEGYKNFLLDMGKRPSSKHTIDRRRNDLGYSPENCRWVDRYVQMNNTRKNIYFEWNGRTQTLSQWAHELNISVSALYARLVTMKWSTDKAFSTTVLSRTRNS